MLLFFINLAKKNLLYYNMPMSLSYFWNMGSMLVMIYMNQLITGILLSFFYLVSEKESFFQVNFFIENNISVAYMLRILHINFVSFFFINIFMHVFRNLFFKSYNKKMTWISGMSLLLILMLTSFMGYVLPWGQMSFWGATVISSFLIVIPVFGKNILNMLWSSFFISNNLLSMFFSLHFLFPFILLLIMLFHMFFLHKNISSNKMHMTLFFNKNIFMNVYIKKDMMNLFLMFLFLEIVMLSPFIFDDEENSKIANSSNSPIHIKPEWYFLFAYAILRSIPNKLMGVISMGLSIIIFYFFMFKKTKKMSKKSKFMSYIFMIVFFLLTWIGMNPVEMPYIVIGQYLMLMYFLIIFL